MPPLLIAPSPRTACFNTPRVVAGYPLGTAAEQAIVRDMKERLAYVAADYEAELARATTDRGARQLAVEQYELPDGQVVSLGAERFRCAELGC